MRWAELFADLEGQAAEWERRDLDAEIADRTRAEVGQVTLANRLRASVGRRFDMTLVSVGHVAGRLEQVGADWVLLSTPEDCVVPLPAVLTVRDLPAAAVGPDQSRIESRVGLTSALRAITVDRAGVTVVVTDGTRLVGTPQRVGADFVDLALHPTDEAPRRQAVTAKVTVPHRAIALVRRNEADWG